MSKYESLWSYIKNTDKDSLVLSYKEIEEILSFPIDHSFLKYKKELEEYGYKVDKISIKKETVSFIKSDI